MQLYDVIEQALLLRPDARGVVLSHDLYAQHALEQADDLIESGECEGLTFYVAGRQIIEDTDLAPGSIEFVTWPDGIPADWSPA